MTSEDKVLDDAASRLGFLAALSIFCPEECARFKEVVNLKETTPKELMSLIEGYFGVKYKPEGEDF